MGKNKKNVNSEQVDNIESVNSIIFEDTNNIKDAVEEAIEEVDSIVYSDNLAPSNNNLNTTEEEITNNIIEENATSQKDETINIKDVENLTTSNKKSYKSIIITSIISIVILILFLLFSTIFALLNNNKTTIINGVNIKGIDISGLTKEQAIEKISPVFDKNLSKVITLKHNEYETTIVPSQLEVNFSLEEAVDMAYNKGRSGNIFQNNFDILISLLSNTQINPGFSYNEDILNSLVKDMETNLSDRLIEPSYYIENNNLIISKGKNGTVINSDKLKSDIIYIINNLNSDISKIDIPTEFKSASTLDLNKVHEEIYHEPKDAYFTTNPYAIYPHVDGVDFAISMEEALNIFNSNTDSCSIPLKILPPAITTNQLGKEAFPNSLGAYSTTYSTRNVNRSTNIRLASQKINGIVIMPGEVFSYNTTVGKRTAAAGFKSAAVYSGGEVTTGIGGGICQVSSTLYNSVLLANLEIIERYNHGFNPGYVPAGRDATVSWGGPDFKFKNNRNYPIRITCSGTGGKIYVEIFGLKEENECQVEIQSYITRYISYSTIEKKDPTLPKGQKKVLESGSNGCKSVAYRILKSNGQVISKTLLSQDTYSPHNRIVAVGTKEVKQVPQTPIVEPSPQTNQIQ